MVLLIGYRDPARLRVMRWCRRNKIPVFVWSDINALGQHSQGIRAFVKSQYLRWIDRQIAAWLICGSAGRQYLERFGINGRRLFVSPCEPAYEQIDAVSREQVAQAQTQFGLDPARRRIVCSGRFVESKRFDLAIDAFAAVAGQRDEWDLLILGDGPLNNALRARVPSGLANRVTFAGFVPDPATVWALYKSCDVLLHVPDHEAWGLVVNEAAACGMALVCSDVVGAAVELVRDGFNGRIVPRNDLAATTAALLDVTDPERLTVYRGNSRTMLDAWRTNADPVDGFRRALAFAGLSG
jgi:glycosyltransferase involved in cell wall biosynthesis